MTRSAAVANAMANAALLARGDNRELLAGVAGTGGRDAGIVPAIARVPGVAVAGADGRADKTGPEIGKSLETRIRSCAVLGHSVEPRRKYGNEPRLGPSPLGPRTYDSGREARMAEAIEADRAAGRIATWLPQCSIPVGIIGERLVRIMPDALVILELRPDGTFVGRFDDAKGKETEAWRAKRGALRALYGLEVTLR